MASENSGSVMMVAGLRVDEHHPVPLALQGAAGLGAGVVELAGLADDDRAGAKDEDGVDIGTSGHGGAEVYIRDSPAAGMKLAMVPDRL